MTDSSRPRTLNRLHCRHTRIHSHLPSPSLCNDNNNSTTPPLSLLPRLHRHPRWERARARPPKSTLQSSRLPVYLPLVSSGTTTLECCELAVLLRIRRFSSSTLLSISSLSSPHHPTDIGMVTNTLNLILQHWHSDSINNTRHRRPSTFLHLAKIRLLLVVLVDALSTHVDERTFPISSYFLK